MKIILKMSKISDIFDMCKLHLKTVPAGGGMINMSVGTEQQNSIKKGENNMKKRNEEMFINTIEAQYVIEGSRMELEQNKVALKYSKLHLMVLGGGSLLSGIVTAVFGNTEFGAGLASSIFGITFMALLVIGILVYAKGGGFKYYARQFAEFAKWGWRLIPVFPLDIMIGLAIFLYGLYAMVFLPIFFVKLRERRLNRNITEAERFLSRCVAA